MFCERKYTSYAKSVPGSLINVESKWKPWGGYCHFNKNSYYQNKDNKHLEKRYPLEHCKWEYEFYKKSRKAPKKEQITT